MFENSFDLAVYSDCAKRWRETAACLPEDDPERTACLELAKGYETLAALLENRKHLASSQF